MSVDLSTLQLFVRVAAQRAIGRAGQDLGFSAATATQRLQQLEKELGVSLFLRTTRMVTLTADGERFLPYAKSMLLTMEDARVDLTGGESRIKGLLRVTASATFGRRYLAPYVSEFLRAHPEAEIDIQFSDTVSNIVEQGYDLAIRIGVLNSSSLRARKLADNPRVLVAAPSYLKGVKPIVSPQDLMSHQCLLLGEENRWEFESKGGNSEKIFVAGRLSSNYGETILSAALGGSGIAMKSLWDVKDYLDSGELTVVLPSYKPLPQWNIWAVMPPGNIIPARTRVFMGFLQNYFDKLPKHEER